MTVLERIAHRKANLQKVLDEKEALLRQAESQERAEVRRLHHRHLWTLAKLLEEVGLADHDAETLRPWLKEVAVRMEQGAAGEEIAIEQGRREVGP